MPDKKEVKEQEKVNEPKQVQEAPEATIHHLQEQLGQAYQMLDQYAKENKILRASIKALTQLL